MPELESASNIGKERVMGKQGCGTNDNGDRQCAFCGENDLIFEETLFLHNDIH